jgi:hypothetical protein
VMGSHDLPNCVAMKIKGQRRFHGSFP